MQNSLTKSKYLSKSIVHYFGPGFCRHLEHEACRPGSFGAGSTRLRSDVCKSQKPTELGRTKFAIILTNIDLKCHLVKIGNL